MPKRLERHDDGVGTVHPAHRPRPLHILVVDDRAAAAEALSTLLVAQGHSVVVCANASTALAQAKTSKPDVVMLGIDLPDLSGYELLRQLHALPGGKDATYVAVAGFGQSHDKVITKAAGFEHQLVEPVSAASLQRILSPVK